MQSFCMWQVSSIEWRPFAMSELRSLTFLKVGSRGKLATNTSTFRRQGGSPTACRLGCCRCWGQTRYLILLSNVNGGRPEQREDPRATDSVLAPRLSPSRECLSGVREGANPFLIQPNRPVCCTSANHVDLAVASELRVFGHMVFIKPLDQSFAFPPSNTNPLVTNPPVPAYCSTWFFLHSSLLLICVRQSSTSYR
jgi:hypothetical protein